jgi:hypothetical protein
VRVEIASQIADNPLLEMIVQKDSQPTETILRHEGGKTDRDQRPEQLRLILADDLIDYHLGDRGKDDDHQSATDRAGQRAHGHCRIAFNVAKDPNEDVHRSSN